MKKELVARIIDNSSKIELPLTKQNIPIIIDIIKRREDYDFLRMHYGNNNNSSKSRHHY